MNFAALWIPRFALLALQRQESGLAGQPVAVVAGEGRKAVIVESSIEAEGTLGLAVPLATARCPGLQLREPNPAAEQEAQRLLVAAAFALSPRVESTARGCCTVDLQGADPAQTLAAMHRQVAELSDAGLPVRIGAGETPLLARFAAQRADPILIVEDRAAFLRELPLSLALPTPGQTEVLHGWGIKTLGGLTALAKGEIGRRLGPEGALLWDRAHGESPRVLRLMEPSRTFAADWAYDPPVEFIEPILFKLRRFAERVALELRSAGMVAATLALTLLLEDETEHYREFRLPEPGANVDSWLRVLQTHLDTLRLAERVAGVRLLALPARPVQRQDGLFETGLTDPHAFWENLARLSAVVGPHRVGTPVNLDTHAPDACVLERPFVTVSAPEPLPIHPEHGGLLRRFRPPWPIRVLCVEALPMALDGGVRGEIRARRGPFLLSGEWWKPGAWAVETWQVELAEGGLYQLSRDRAGWWLDGTLD
ncbi:MAG: polymerase [Verrucomicrobia bacterium]|nr:polymerase [Verrucomicrobiota bacterium]